jgi:hypothetical protein
VFLGLVVLGPDGAEECWVATDATQHLQRQNVLPRGHEILLGILLRFLLVVVRVASPMRMSDKR